ncbi:hypothetical protein DZF95_03935 [Clavibacter michiganensis]|nr:hypothetical protein DZF95_03935 [Clavibacter michiganensis]
MPPTLSIDERHSLLRAARSTVATYLACAPRCDARGALAEAAIRDATDAGIHTTDLADELKISHLLLTAVIEGTRPIAALYNTAHTD